MKKDEGGGGNKKVSMGALWNASTIGMAFVSSIFIGAAIGFYLDKFFGTKPYLLLFFLLMGIIAGFRNAFYFLKRTGLWHADEIKSEKDK